MHILRGLMQDSSDKFMNAMLATAVIFMFSVPVEIEMTQHIKYSFFGIPLVFGLILLLCNTKRVWKND